LGVQLFLNHRHRSPSLSAGQRSRLNLGRPSLSLHATTGRCLLGGGIDPRYAVGGPRSLGHQAHVSGQTKRGLDHSLGKLRPGPLGRHLPARTGAGRGGGHRQGWVPFQCLVRRHRPPRFVRLRADLLCPTRQRASRPACALGTAATRRPACSGTSRGGGPGYRYPRLIHGGRRGLRAGIRDTLFRGPGEEPIRRKDIHRARPEVAGPGGPSKV